MATIWACSFHVRPTGHVVTWTMAEKPETQGLAIVMTLIYSLPTASTKANTFNNDTWSLIHFKDIIFLKLHVLVMLIIMKIGIVSFLTKKETQHFSGFFSCCSGKLIHKMSMLNSNNWDISNQVDVPNLKWGSTNLQQMWGGQLELHHLKIPLQ